MQTPLIAFWLIISRIYCLAIIKGLAGFPDRSTDSVNINRIPDLYESLSDTLQNEFVTPNLISEVRESTAMYSNLIWTYAVLTVTTSMWKILLRNL